jgi:hypothetical protein
MHSFVCITPVVHGFLWIYFNYKTIIAKILRLMILRAIEAGVKDFEYELLYKA